MAPDSVDVHGQMEAFESRLGALEARIRELENRAPALGSSIPVVASVPSSTIVTEPPRGTDAPLLPAGILALTGRTLVVLGGAFLLRALTDEKLLPAFGGIAAGLIYAALWLLRADRDARADCRLSAVFHGLTALGVGYPIVLETTLRFHLIGPSLAGMLLVGCFGAGLLIAERRQLPTLAWANAMLAAASGLVLLIGTRDLLPLTAALLAIGALIESRDWHAVGPRALIALAADLGVAICVIIAGRAGGPPEGYAALPLTSVVVVALLLPTLYVCRAALRTLRDAAPLGAFSMLQAPLALLIGFGGAASVLSVQNAPTWPLGAAASLLALGCYLAAFAVVDRRKGQASTFYAYTTLALLLVFAGLGEILSREPRALVFGALGILVLSLAERHQRQTLRFHGLAYVAASAAAGGLLGVARNGLLTDPRAAWQPMTGLAWIGLVALALGYAIQWRSGRLPSVIVPRLLPAMVMAAFFVAGAAGFAVTSLAGALALAPGPEADQARVAAIRTVVIAALAMGLAASGTRWRRRELVALARVALAAGALSVLLQLPGGRPATLFVALAAYGGALLATPRLLGDRPASVLGSGVS